MSDNTHDDDGYDAYDPARDNTPERMEEKRRYEEAWAREERFTDEELMEFCPACLCVDLDQRFAKTPQVLCMHARDLGKWETWLAEGSPMVLCAQHVLALVKLEVAANKRATIEAQLRAYTAWHRRAAREIGHAVARRLTHELRVGHKKLPKQYRDWTE